MVLRVELLRIETFPPRALAVGLGELAVVGHARQRAVRVGALRRLVPAPRVRGVHADAEAQPVLARRLAQPAMSPSSARRRRVPRLVRAVPQVEVVVVVRQRDEVLRARLLVERHELVRIPALGLPRVDDVLEAELRRVAVLRR